MNIPVENLVFPFTLKIGLGLRTQIRSPIRDFFFLL